MPDLFDMELRALRRDRAARIGPELFLLNRAFEDCLARIDTIDLRFERALVIGCPNPSWIGQLSRFATATDVHDPGNSFSLLAGGSKIIEDQWEPPQGAFDLVVAIGTLDTVNDLPLAFNLINHGMRKGGLFIGTLSGGETLPQLRASMRAADALFGEASPHVHPRIDPALLATLLDHAGFFKSVIDLDRVKVRYRSFGKLISDLRAMGATNILKARPKMLTRAQRLASEQAFLSAGEEGSTNETFELIHFAAWRRD